MEMNFYAILAAAISSIFVGFIWYNPKVFGNTWMKEIGKTQDDMRKPNMFLLFGSAIVYSILISFFLQFIVIHQTGAMSATMNIKNVDPSILDNYMKAYGHTYRTFKHGALHGVLAGLFFALPILGSGALWEQRSFKYVLITGGYWVITLAIMGGIICCWE